jgi:TfoX/Sxy family transcriptional regulator of competence genes
LTTSEKRLSVVYGISDYPVKRSEREIAMAYDENFAQRIRDALARKKNIEEKKMFGGICFLLNGNILVGVWKDSLIARLGPDEGEDALLEPHAKAFDLTGKPMKNWILVEPKGVEDEDQLKDWIQRAAKFVGTLPGK